MKLNIKINNDTFHVYNIHDFLVYANSKWFEKKRWINTINIMSR